jgi:hypothetical protein
MHDDPAIPLSIGQNVAFKAAFVFFLSVDERTRRSTLMAPTVWHRQLMSAVPELITGTPDRVVAVRSG